MSDLHPPVRDAIVRGNEMDDAGRYDEAERAYSEAILLLGDRNEVMRGTLEINLGTTSRNAGRLRDAAKHFKRAIRLLEGHGGDALVQSAHAYWNLAMVRLEGEHDDAATLAGKARRRYERLPFTSATDLADAALLETVARYSIDRQLAEGELEETWRVVSRADGSALNRDLLLSFLITAMSMEIALLESRGDEARFERWTREVLDWAPRDIGATLLAQFARDD